MRDLPDLMRPILADPMDDGARLVYADAIEETDPARAEFIRVQIAYSSEVNCHASPCCTIPFRGHEIGFNLGMVGTWIIRRGFPDSVTLPLARLVGGTCGRCRARSDWYDALTGSGECYDCRGTGRIHSLAPVLARWPLTSVTISDAVIHESTGAGYFYVGGLGAFPQKYWKMLDYLPSRHAARKSLSDAAISFVRETAGLGPLKQTKSLAHA